MVYQEMLCFPNLTVTANIFAGREITRGEAAWSKAEMRAAPARCSTSCTSRITPDAPRRIAVGRASAAAAGRARARVRVPDPRARRADDVADRCGDGSPVRRARQAQGRRRHAALRVAPAAGSVPAVRSHHGAARRRATSGPTSVAASRPDDIVRAMVGRDLPPRTDDVQRRGQTQPRVLDVNGLASGPMLPQRLAARRAPARSSGCSGSSDPDDRSCSRRSSASTAPTPARSPVDGRRVTFGPRGTRRAPASRSCPKSASVRDCSSTCRSVTIWCCRAHACQATCSSHRREREEAQRLLADWRIKAAGVDVTPDTLSGGNQQKIVVAKWLATRPRVLLLDEPTKGVDVGAKFEIHEIIRRQAAGGMGCLVASSDLPEVLALARPDRRDARRANPRTRLPARPRPRNP